MKINNIEENYDFKKNTLISQNKKIATEGFEPSILAL